MKQNKQSILIADDDIGVITALKLLLKAENYEVVTASSPQELLLVLQRRDFSVALIDLNYQKDTTSGNEGLALIDEIKAQCSDLPIVVMTGYSSVDVAVEAMKRGASDFIQKPWGNDRLLSILQAQINLGEMARQSAKLSLHNELLRTKDAVTSEGIVAQSYAMTAVMEQITKLAKSDMNILFTGENGCGKSMLADYLHQCSGRCDNAFISVNMGAISENLFESEMFGHAKGAFTDAKEQRIGRFELADEGTLFLDEIANIPMSQQAKLLRVLEEQQFERVGSSKTQQVNVRIISATNANLTELVAQGSFRQDLYYRLNTVEIHIPSLQERREDIIPLAGYFLEKFSQKYGLSHQGFDDDAKQALLSYTWPGNIRELSHMIERAIFLSSDHMINVKDLGLNDGHGSSAEMLTLQEQTLEQIEKQLIIERLQRFDGDAQETAASLGLSRSAYYRRLEKYGI